MCIKNIFIIEYIANVMFIFYYKSYIFFAKILFGCLLIWNKWE